MFHFAFPTDPMDRRRIDEYFAPQRASLSEAGFPTSLVPDNAFESVSPIMGLTGNPVIYRGWMLDSTQYQNFADSIEAGGGYLYTSPEQYLLAHHLPNWYPALSDLTPETVVFSETIDLESELRNLAWPAFFLKDYVKSLKTSAGSLITDASEARRVVDDMRRFRGQIEGGICVRRVEQFRPDSEVRYFILRGRPFAPNTARIPDIVAEVAKRIFHPFFTVDVALREDGVLRVVELGDGQVSDLVGWTLEAFMTLWHEAA